MSDRLKSSISVISMVVGITIGIFGFIQAYAVLPYRVDQNEKTIRTLTIESRDNRELLIRIEERVKDLQSKLDKQLTR